ncbi:MAG TPA: YwiC-like family protein, partial [Pyrinomonadaceae bacterium]|nr:YwiC-like family protein [Pyrinomonadaceae bacterium]
MSETFKSLEMSGTVSIGVREREGDKIQTRREPVPARVRLRTVALPVEHGGWSFTLEPVALGLLVAPSIAGLFLAFAAAGAFLARHPLKIVLGDRRRGRRFPRTAAAEVFLLLYGALTLASALGAAATAVSYAFLLPLLLAVPLVAVQLAFDAAGRSRSLAPELAGSAGLAAVSASIAMADGWTFPASSVLWALLAGRAIPSTLYVRARLRLLHGEKSPLLPVIVAHAVAFALVSLLVWVNLAPTLAALALFILLLRAVLGLLAQRHKVSAKRVGIAEVG